MRENNLLVIEMKTNHEAQRGNGGSIDSVRTLMREYGYQYGVLLDLRLSGGLPNPSWQWLDEATAGEQATPESKLVYEVEDLNALIERGREEERRRYPQDIRETHDPGMD